MLLVGMFCTDHPLKVRILRELLSVTMETKKIDANYPDARNCSVGKAGALLGAESQGHWP